MKKAKAFFSRSFSSKLNRPTSTRETSHTSIHAPDKQSESGLLNSNADKRYPAISETDNQVEAEEAFPELNIDMGNSSTSDISRGTFANSPVNLQGSLKVNASVAPENQNSTSSPFSPLKNWKTTIGNGDRREDSDICADISDVILSEGVDRVSKGYSMSGGKSSIGWEHFLERSRAESGHNTPPPLFSKPDHTVYIKNKASSDVAKVNHSILCGNSHHDDKPLPIFTSSQVNINDDMMISDVEEMSTRRENRDTFVEAEPKKDL